MVKYSDFLIVIQRKDSMFISLSNILYVGAGCIYQDSCSGEEFLWTTIQVVNNEMVLCLGYCTTSPIVRWASFLTELLGHKSQFVRTFAERHGNCRNERIKSAAVCVRSYVRYICEARTYYRPDRQHLHDKFKSFISILEKFNLSFDGD